VFSASNNAPLTHINVFDYDGEYLTWATNGFAGYMKIISGKFSINADRGLLKPKLENINPKYIKYQLEPILRELAKGRKGKKGKDEFTKVYPSMILNIEINIPINSKKEIDIFMQNQLVEKLIFIEGIKQKIAEYKKQIKDLDIEIEDINGNTKLVNIEDIFKIEKGKSIYTNEFIVKNEGKFPLYSSQTTNDGIIGNINSFDYDCDAITWTTDGIYAGTVFLRKGKFSMTTHCGALIFKSNIKSILLDYVYSYLRNHLKQFAVGEQNKRVTTTIIKPIEIPIPVNSKGEFDLFIQKEIAEKYKRIENIKFAINTELDKIANVKIDL
jgi:hypothetical protein